MRVTTKGQVTIPRHIRESLGIGPGSEVDFRKDNGNYIIVKTKQGEPKPVFRKFRGIASAKMTTDQIMQLTREQ